MKKTILFLISLLLFTGGGAYSASSDIPQTQLKVTATESDQRFPVSNLIDGSPESIWTTRGERSNPVVMFSLGSNVVVDQIRFMPRVHPNGNEIQQGIYSYKIIAGKDSADIRSGRWYTVLSGRISTPNSDLGERTISFSPTECKYLGIQITEQKGFYAAGEFYIRKAEPGKKAVPLVDEWVYAEDGGGDGVPGTVGTYTADYKESNPGSPIKTGTTVKDPKINYSVFNDFQSETPDSKILSNAAETMTAYVKTDPENKDNKVFKLEMRPLEGKREDVSYLGSFAPIAGKVVFSVKYRFAGILDYAAYSRDFQFNLGAVDNNYGRPQTVNFNMKGLTVQSVGTISGTVTGLDIWNEMTMVVDCDSGTYDMYFNKLPAGTNMPLIKSLNGSDVDYSKGFNSFSFRFYNENRVSGGAAYLDDIIIYQATANDIEKIQKEAKDAEDSIVYYGSELQGKLNNAITLYIDSPISYVNNKISYIDAENPYLKPFTEDGRTLVPVRFISEKLGGKVDWNDAAGEITITLNGRTVKMAVNDNKITVDGKAGVLDVPAKTYSGRTFIPLRAMAEAVGREVFWYDKGMIVISQTPEIFNEQADEEKLYELFAAKYGVRKPDIADFTVAESDYDTIGSRYRYSNRNSREELAKLARDLFNYVDLSRPELAGIKALYESGNYNQALDAYRDYFLNNVKETDWILQVSPLTNLVVNSDGNELLYNVTASPAGKKTYINDPGSVPWGYGSDFTQFNMRGNEYYMLHINQFNSLITSYLQSNKSAYLAKWAEFVDDWAVNNNGIDKRSSINASYNSDVQMVRNTLDLIYIFHMVTKKAETTEWIASPTFTRALLQTVKKYTPVTGVYSRQNPQNWANDNTTLFAAAGYILGAQGMTVGSEYLNEARTLLGIYDYHLNALDGTELQKDLWYNRMWLEIMYDHINNLIKNADEEVFSANFMTMFKESIYKRLNALTRTWMPDGRYPLVLRGDARYDNAFVNMIEYYAPELKSMPDIAAVMSLAKGEKGANPSFTSDALPYAGYHFIRTGWDIKDQYGTFYSAGNPSDGFRVQADNALGISAFGEDLIVGGETTTYNMVPSPLTVDGRGQNAELGMYGMGHKRLYPALSIIPPKFRWHTSNTFDVAEGIYNGAYANDSRGGFSKVNDDVVNAVHGVSFQRIVNFAREAGLWIVSDKITSEEQHNYVQTFRLPVEPTNSGTYSVFNKDSVKIDPTARTFTTEQYNKVNISGYQFTSNDVNEKMTMTSKYEPQDTHASFMAVSNSFTNVGSAPIITVLYPRDQDAADLSSISRIGDGVNTVGIDATAPKGGNVKYMMAVNETADISVSSVSMHGESLLVSGNRAVALGVKSISVSGAEQDVPYSDFEFVISGSGMSDVTPIYTPVDPVEFNPPYTGFTDKITVELSSRTEDTDIRYTVDGSNPTLNSPLYQGPFTVTKDTFVKAVAFRKGVTKMPNVEASTTMSQMTIALYEKLPLNEAVNPGNVSNGLNYSYHQGYWKDMWAFLDNEPVIKTGKVDRFFDISNRETNDAFAFKYSGYINVPEDGAYTFYIPNEYTDFSIDAGYKIDMFVDGERWDTGKFYHARNTYSVGLKAGMHKIQINYIDYREEVATVSHGGETMQIRFDKDGVLEGKARTNFPSFAADKNITWDGAAPEFFISGPNMEKQPIPAGMLFSD